MLTTSQKLAVGLPLIMFIALPLMFFAFNSAEFREFAQRENAPFFPGFPLVFFLGFAAFYAWSVFSLPYRISVTQEGKLVFKSLLHARSVRVSELLSIEPRSLSIQAGVSGYLLRHQNGKLKFPGQFTGLYMLLHELKQANPRLDIRGC